MCILLASHCTYRRSPRCKSHSDEEQAFKTKQVVTTYILFIQRTKQYRWCSIWTDANDRDDRAMWFCARWVQDRLSYTACLHNQWLPALWRCHHANLFSLYLIWALLTSRLPGQARVFLIRRGHANSAVKALLGLILTSTWREGAAPPKFKLFMKITSENFQRLVVDVDKLDVSWPALHNCSLHCDRGGTLSIDTCKYGLHCNVNNTRRYESLSSPANVIARGQFPQYGGSLKM